MSKRAIVVCGLCLVALLATATAASAAPVWDAKLRWGSHVLQPGAAGPVEPGEDGNGEFVVRVRNLGDTASSGTVTTTLELPPGVTRIPPTEFDGLFELGEGIGWTCEGATTVTCTRTKAVDPFDLGSPRSPAWSTGSGRDGAPGFAPLIHIRVSVAPDATGTATSEATVSGGGAAEPASDVEPIRIGGPAAGFGIAEGSFAADVFDARYPAGERVRQAGDHPYELRIDFDMKLRGGESPSPLPPLISPQSFTRPIGDLRSVEQTLPVGFIGNPEATPKCEMARYMELGASQYTSSGCPPETQVGVMNLEVGGLFNGTSNHGYGGLYTHASMSRIPVYNLDPPKGVAADFGFSVADYRGHIYPTLDPANGYAIKASVPDISSILPVRQAEFVMWGVPGDPAHTDMRARPLWQGGTLEEAYGATSSTPIRPLLTMPVSCGDRKGFRQRVDSWQNPGQWSPLEESSHSMNVTGCDDPRIRFEPEIELKPTSEEAGGPTGLRVDLQVPQRENAVKDAKDLYADNGNVNGVSTPPVKKAVVTLPEGMTVSPSAAQGLASCSPEQIGLGTNQPVRCPDAAQYGTLTLHTPILPRDEPMQGRVFVAEQDNNSFNSFLALYLVIQDPDRDLLVKVPGRVDLDPATGQITTTFDDLPQFPFSSMQMNLKGGARAALVNPQTCGAKTITATFYSWHDPSTPIVRESPYEMGGDCVNNLADRPFEPRLSSGSANPVGGASSPLEIQLTRSDRDQELSTVEGTAPRGLIASLRGVGRCSEAQIAAAADPSRSGKAEQASPSCPAASRVGSVQAGAGVGGVLTYVRGDVYMAGPYKGAPVSGVVVTPAVAGPFDLGVIVTRAPARLDPVTAQIRLTADPLPQIFKGIPVRIRDVRVSLDRPGFTRNPTNCEEMSFAGQLGSVYGIARQISNRFQVSDCAALGFQPGLSLGLTGGTRRGGHPAMRAVLNARPGDANIGRARVTLPSSAFLDQAHIRTICTRVQFASDSCPKAAIYGYATAWTPLLDEPIQGPVYLRSSTNKLPDMVAALRGPDHTPIKIELAGRIDSVKVRGGTGIRASFDTVPDAPVTRFVLTMQGGRKGLIVNSRNLCQGKNRAKAEFTGQNGKAHDVRPLVKPSCGKRRKG